MYSARLLMSGLVHAAKKVLPISRYSPSRGKTNSSGGVEAAVGDATLKSSDTDVSCSLPMHTHMARAGGEGGDEGKWGVTVAQVREGVQCMPYDLPVLKCGGWTITCMKEDVVVGSRRPRDE